MAVSCVVLVVYADYPDMFCGNTSWMYVNTFGLGNLEFYWILIAVMYQQKKLEVT